MATVHPFYESHRGAMEAAMRHRLDLAEPMLRERTHLSDLDGIRHEVTNEFEIVLTQTPYVGGQITSHMVSNSPFVACPAAGKSRPAKKAISPGSSAASA